MPFLPYARLLRLPNVFTAFADIALGICVAAGASARLFEDDWSLIPPLLLLLASGCLYLGGMVWNDYFDLEEDTRDRPFRPLPSKQIAVRTAFMIGVLLFVVGLVAATLSGLGPNQLNLGPAIIATMLAVAILAYDARVKRTKFGPIGMGFCRFLNVLLGLTLIDRGLPPEPVHLHLAAVVGLYIVGVTWFARTEEKRSNPTTLRWAALVMLAVLGLALAVPIRVPAGTSWVAFPYLLTAFGFFIGIPVYQAIRQPTPQRVQAGVKRCILGLVALDAILATVFVGPAGLLILLLLPPALLLGKWVYST